jgi:hypothetical protein
MSYQARLMALLRPGFRNGSPRSLDLDFLGSWTVVLLLILAKQGIGKGFVLQVALGSAVLYAVQGMPS